jgi:NADPH:quinone reductase-like Zn-dependent oxidoreductase
VLILAAAGGVGHLAVQIAKARGAYVIGTARAEKHAFLASLGADEAVDYTTGPLAGRVDDVDVVFDSGGTGGRAEAALPTLHDDGVLVTAASGSGLGPLRRRRGRQGTGDRDPGGAGSCGPGVAGGARRGRTVCDRTSRRRSRSQMPPVAHQRGETGRTQGKLVLTVG